MENRFWEKGLAKIREKKSKHAADPKDVQDFLSELETSANSPKQANVSRIKGWYAKLKQKKIWFPKTKKGKVALGAGCMAVIVAGTFTFNTFFRSQEAAAEYTEYTVQRGDIEETISGSGTIEAAATYEVVSLVKGEVLSDTFEEGDVVEEDQLLYVIDSSDTETTVDRAKLSLEQAQDSYEESQKTVAELTVTAPISGKIADLTVEKGDDVQSGTVVATIYDDSSLEVTVPFTSADAQSLYVGQSVTVTLADTFETLSGTITKISNAEQMLDGYIAGRNVTVKVSNPGLLQSETYATVTAGQISSYGSGMLEYTESESVKVTSSATVTSVNYSNGESISAGATLMSLESDSAESTLKNSKRSYEDALLSYENTLDELDNYNITAPISGTVISKNVKAGDTIDNTSSSVVMATIADMSSMSFEISVDELDVSKMEVGQSVRITADALEDTEFSGTVTNVSLLAESTNGVTSYPVTITLDEIPDGLWPGMNVTGEIVVESSYDTLLIPLTAVSRGNMVLVPEDSELAQSITEAQSGETERQETSAEKEDVKEEGNGEREEKTSERLDAAVNGGADKESITRDSGSEDALSSGVSRQQKPGTVITEGAPEGYVYIVVELGLNDDSNIEILDGLSEGDVIAVAQTARSSSEDSEDKTQMSMGSGGMGGMSGGMPSGGMPSGGMPSGGGMPGGGMP